MSINLGRLQVIIIDTSLNDYRMKSRYSSEEFNQILHTIQLSIRSRNQTIKFDSIRGPLAQLVRAQS
jgi:hypothetical protein